MRRSITFIVQAACSVALITLSGCSASNEPVKAEASASTAAATESAEPTESADGDELAAEDELAAGDEEAFSAEQMAAMDAAQTWCAKVSARAGEADYSSVAVDDDSLFGLVDPDDSENLICQMGENSLLTLEKGRGDIPDDMGLGYQLKGIDGVAICAKKMCAMSAIFDGRTVSFIDSAADVATDDFGPWANELALAAQAVPLPN